LPFLVDWLLQVLGRGITFTPIPLDTLLGFLPLYAKEIIGYCAGAGETAVPLSDAVATLTGRHTTYEQWLSRPQNRALFE
jgi:hypothetical protein